MPPQPITLLAYGSLAELYQHYIRELVEASPIASICGCRIHCYEHHFVHMVKLFGPEHTRLEFPEERHRILEETVGFGTYEHEERRSVRLLMAIETMRFPDFVVRTPNLATADRAFIKEFACSQYPYMVVLVRREKSILTLCTAQPTRRRNMKQWMAGEILFPKTPQPPLEVAV